jgi:hypothetical protein
MVPDFASDVPSMIEFWRLKLFEEGFPPWLTEIMDEQDADWLRIIPLLASGNVYRGYRVPIPAILCDTVLRRLTAMAFISSKKLETHEPLRLSLQRDGFDVPDGELRAIDGPVSVEQEQSRLLADLKISKLGRKDVISKHVLDAMDLFGNGKHHAAINEGRSAFQGVIDETVVLVGLKVGSNSGGGVANQFEFLEKHGFLSQDDRKAFEAAWGFLCSGSHPGVPPEESGRIGTILCLEFIQILLIKGKALL